MSFREEDRRKNSSTSRGLGLAAAAIGVGVGAALYYIFSKRQEQPDSEGATSENWTTEEPQTFVRIAPSTPPSRIPSFIDKCTTEGTDTQLVSPLSEYTTISEHTTTDTSVHDSEIEADQKSSKMSRKYNCISLRSILTPEDNKINDRRRIISRVLFRSYHESDSDSDNTSSSSNSIYRPGTSDTSVDFTTSDSSDEDNVNVTQSERDSESEDEDFGSTDSNTSSSRDPNYSVEDPDSNDSNTSNESVEEPDSNDSNTFNESVEDSDSIYSNAVNESIEFINSLMIVDSLTYNRNDTLNSGYESDQELSDWDVTSSSRDVPVVQEESTLLRYLAGISDIIGMFRIDEPTIRDRERKWSLEECAICFDVMLRDQPLMALPCTHNFHVSCIGPWLQERQTCPVCRKAA